MSLCRICEGTGEDGICHECLQEWWVNNSDTKKLQAEIDGLKAELALGKAAAPAEGEAMNKCTRCEQTVRPVGDDGLCDRCAHESLLQMREAVGGMNSETEKKEMKCLNCGPVVFSGFNEFCPQCSHDSAREWIVLQQAEIDKLMSELDTANTHAEAAREQS